MKAKITTDNDNNLDKYQNNTCQSRHMYDRIVRTMSNHLMFIGKEEMNEKILQIIIPMMEEDMDDLVVKEILLPNAYKNLRNIYEHCYNTKLKEYYNEKYKELTEISSLDFSRNLFMDLSKLNNTLENEIIIKLYKILSKSLIRNYQTNGKQIG